VLIRRHLQADGLRRVAREVDDHALDQGHVLVADEGVLPLLDLGRADVGRDQGHGAGLALVLLEGGDLLAIRRPHQHGLVGVLPAGVVGGIAVVGLAVEGQLDFLAGRDIAHPQVPAADEGLARMVGRCCAGFVAGLGAGDRRAGLGLAAELGAGARGHHQRAILQADAGDGQAVRLHRPALAAGGLVDRFGQGLGVEGRDAGARRRIEASPGRLAALGIRVHRGAIVEPGAVGHQSVDQRGSAIAQHPRRALVVRRRQRRRGKPPGRRASRPSAAPPSSHPVVPILAIASPSVASPRPGNPRIVARQLNHRPCRWSRPPAGVDMALPYFRACPPPCPC
jgi:hypothetical protein